MSRLLSANFIRLKKSKIFWIGIIFMFGFGLILPISQYMDDKRWHAIDPLYGGTPLDSVFLGYALVIGIVCAVFSSLFLGTEYSNGTIRNKLIVGRTRGTIYFSNLVVNIAVSLLMCICYLIPICAVGIPLLGTMQTDLIIVIKIILVSIMMTIAFSSVVTMISMINQNKAVTAIINVVLVFCLLFASTIISVRLNQPEFYQWTSEENGVETVQYEKNSYYVSGTKRDVYEFLNDFLPSSQALRIVNMSDVNALTIDEINSGYESDSEDDYLADGFGRLPLYSGIITIVTTGIGVFIFRKKDIK